MRTNRAVRSDFCSGGVSNYALTLPVLELSFGARHSRAR